MHAGLYGGRLSPCWGAWRRKGKEKKLRGLQLHAEVKRIKTNFHIAKFHRPQPLLQPPAALQLRWTYTPDLALLAAVSSAVRTPQPSPRCGLQAATV